MIDYEKIPASTMESIQAWIASGRPTGGFLEAVLSNDLREACGRADEWNRAALFEIVAWLYNYAPCGCWGSPKSVKAWGDQMYKRRKAMAGQA